MGTVADVKFGELDAESEKNLAGYFVDTGVLAKLADGRKHLVLGRKGSGKTALFRLAQGANLRQVTVLDVEFDKYPWDFHRQLKQAGMLAESAFEASWRFLFLLTIAREWKEFGAPDVKKEAKRLVDTIVPDPYKGLFASLLAKMRNPTRVSLPGGSIAKVAALNMGSIDLGKEDAEHAMGLMSIHLDALAEHVSQHYASHPIVIKVDRLDDGWDASEDSKNLIVGQLKAARSLNGSLGKSGSPAPIITFLRSDIFEALRFNDKNKLTTATERLDWTNDRLMDVLNKRVAASLGGAEKDAWTRVFSTDEMLQRAKANFYITKRTMGRPRDIIAFALSCQEVAVEKAHERVETADVYEAELRYSQHLLDELIDELHKQTPGVESYIEILREVGRTTFDVNSWIDAAKRRSIVLTEAMAKDQLGILFDVSVIGVPRIGGKERGTRYVFAYSERNVKPDFSRVMRAHPGVKKSLDLKERRSSDDVDGEGDDQGVDNRG